VHFKATMIKVSDPIISGNFVWVFFEDVFLKHARVFDDLAVKAMRTAHPDLQSGWYPPLYSFRIYAESIPGRSCIRNQ